MLDFLGVKWFRFRVSIHHPLGFNWHPFEGAGMLDFLGVRVQRLEMTKASFWAKISI